MKRKRKRKLKDYQILEANNDVTLDTSISKLRRNEEFGARIYKALTELGCKCTADILALDPIMLHSLPSIGQSSVAQVMAFNLRYKHLLDDATDNTVKPASVVNTSISTEALEVLSKAITQPIRITIELHPNSAPKIDITEINDESLEATKEKAAEKDGDEINEPHKRRKVLEITTPDGLIIREKYAYESLIRFVELVGAEKIASLDIEALPDVPLVSKTIEDVTASKPVGNGWYVYTGIANNIKADVITQICKKLDLKYKVKAYSIIVEQSDT